MNTKSFIVGAIASLLTMQAPLVAGAAVNESVQAPPQKLTKEVVKEIRELTPIEREDLFNGYDGYLKNLQRALIKAETEAKDTERISIGLRNTGVLIGGTAAAGGVLLMISDSFANSKLAVLALKGASGVTALGVALLAGSIAANHDASISKKQAEKLVEQINQVRGQIKIIRDLTT